MERQQNIARLMYEMSKKLMMAFAEIASMYEEFCKSGHVPTSRPSRPPPTVASLPARPENEVERFTPVKSSSVWKDAEPVAGKNTATKTPNHRNSYDEVKGKGNLEPSKGYSYKKRVMALRSWGARVQREEQMDSANVDSVGVPLPPS